MLVVPAGAVCPHTHCRDEEQEEKATTASVLCLAHSQGIGMLFDMPNPERPVTNRYRAWERLELVPMDEEGNYGLYVGLTDNKEQIAEAVWCQKYIPEVMGLKLFAGKSVGGLSVIGREKQLLVYRTLVKHDYRGVVPTHCEQEDLMKPDLWDPTNPISHTLARPEYAEITSVANQIRYALATGFKGTLHVCHVSSPGSVRWVQWAKTQGLRVSCGVTPHHLMWDESRMTREDGLIYKMNPPLRSRRSVLQLRQQLVEGMIDFIETDHAPHTVEEKAPPLCLSGYPSMTLYKELVTDFLPKLGLRQDQIEALTRGNIIQVFGDKIREK